MLLSRNYRLIVAPRKFDVLKTNICPRSEASRANMLVLRTSNFQGATIRPIVPRHKHSIVFIVHHYLFFRASVEKQSKPTLMQINQIFIHAYRLSQMSIIGSVHWLKNSVQLSTVFQRTTTIHPGIFLGRALWADSVSPWTNTIASRDQFKPIRIGENLVVNYND